MTRALRPRLQVAIDRREPLGEPEVVARQFTLRPAGSAPLDAIIAEPERPRGVLLYFPGFNTSLGPWELAKCSHLAQASGLSVILTEIPGMSRFGDPIPKAIRRDMLAGRSDSWAELHLTYLAAALDQAVASPEVMEVLGFSTGCSLAASSLTLLAGWGPIEGLHLVEPVAIGRRSLAGLQAHNLADLSRMPRTLATNAEQPWVVAARRRQRHEPTVRYSPVDLIAIATVLAGSGLRADLAGVDLARCALARGSDSSLCRPADFSALDRLLSARGIPGPTITVDGLGHQLWHSFPALVRLTVAMLADSGNTAP